MWLWQTFALWKRHSPLHVQCLKDVCWNIMLNVSPCTNRSHIRLEYKIHIVYWIQTWTFWFVDNIFLGYLSQKCWTVTFGNNGLMNCSRDFTLPFTVCKILQSCKRSCAEMAPPCFMHVIHQMTNTCLFFTRGQVWPSSIAVACACRSIPRDNLSPVLARIANWNQKCKTPWLKSLLFWGRIDLDLKGKIKFEIKMYPFLIVYAITRHQMKLRFPNFDQKIISQHPY